MKWIAGAPATPDRRLVWLYYKGLICKEFPAYRFDELDHVPIADLLVAMELMGLAQQALSSD